MKIVRLALVALLFASQVHARPNVIDEWARLPLPTDVNWAYIGGFGVAIDGDWALVSAATYCDWCDEGGLVDSAALLYHYTGGSWQYQGILGTRQLVDEWHRPGIAMKEGIAVVTLQDTRLFELVNGTWTEVPYSLPGPATLYGEDIEINGGRVLIPLESSSNTFYVLRKLNGAWSVEGVLSGHHNGENTEQPVTPKADLENGRAVVLNMYDDLYGYNPAAVRRYYPSPAGQGWLQQYALTVPGYDQIGPNIAMSGEYTAFSNSLYTGTLLVYDSENGGQFARYGIQPADGFMQPHYVSDTALERARGMFATRNWSHERQAHVFNLFRVNDDNARTAEHLFTLQAGNGESLGGWIDASGNRVIVSGTFFGQSEVDRSISRTVRIYQLPATYDPIAPQTFAFETANTPAGWTVSPGSTFTVTRVSNNGVWRQPSTANAHTALLTTNRRTTQSIQTELVLRGSSSENSWVGLVTRWVDDSNYYYVTLRTNGRIELKRMVDGVFTTMQSGPADLPVGEKVRLRLESVGGAHRVFLNDRQVLRAFDFRIREGSTGLMTNRAAVDFDNIIAGPGPLATIFTQDFANNILAPWTISGGTWQSSGGVLQQSNSNGYARILTGARTDDHVVQVRVRPLTFVDPAQNYVGLLLRYQDDRNNAFVSWQGRGVIALWRRTNGAIQQLATQRVAMTPGNWYTLRAETVAGETRVFVDDVQVMRSTADLGPSDPDVATPKGRVGLITQYATAEFDDFLAYQP